MKSLLLPLALAAVSWILPSAAAQQRPNFVIIMADDLGYGDVGCFGSESIPTPNIDALAASGITLTDFHSNGAVCSPTRAALLTGRYQQRSGIGGVVTAAGHRHTGLAIDAVTFADALRKNGYATGIFGKWHLGYEPKFNPIHQGFDRFRGYVSGNIDFFSHIDQAGHEDWWKQDKLTPEEGYVTHLITRHGVRFIEQHKDRPFCLYLPHEAPHYPYQGPDDAPIREKGAPGKIQGVRNDIASAYREMVVEMDKGVGEILAALEKHGLAKRTLVLFFSDNGANREGSNGTLRGYKGSAWEGGHRVPAAAAWPGTIAPGSKSDVTSLTMDVFPTLLDAAGIETPDNLDGVSLMPVLTGKDEIGERTLFWHTGRGTAVRRGNWKLVIENRKKGKPAARLFDLARDLGETTPAVRPALVKELEQALREWRASWAGIEQRS